MKQAVTLFLAVPTFAKDLGRLPTAPPAESRQSVSEDSDTSEPISFPRIARDQRRPLIAKVNACETTCFCPGLCQSYVGVNGPYTMCQTFGPPNAKCRNNLYCDQCGTCTC